MGRRITPRRIPPEIVDHIIDYIHDDHRALDACALTSKTFLPRSRYHLFGAVSLDKRSNNHLLTRLYHAPHLASYVRTLQIRRARYTPGSAPSPSPPSPSPGVTLFVEREHGESCWVFLLFASLHVALRSVTRLEMEGVAFTQTFIHNLRILLPNLQELRLNGCYFDSFPRCFELHSAFPRLRSVILSEVVYTPDPKPTCLQCGRLPLHPSVKATSKTNLDVSDRPKIQNLRFKDRVAVDPITSEMLTWMLTENRYSSLATLEIAEVLENELPLVQQVLTEVGPTLRDLTIGFASEVNVEDDVIEDGQYFSRRMAKIPG